jgi:hypothetical protein
VILILTGKEGSPQTITYADTFNVGAHSAAHCNVKRKRNEYDRETSDFPKSQ